MRNKLITNFENRIFASRKPLPEFRSGDTIRVHYKVQEGAAADKFRIQVYEGVVIRNRRGTADSTFTVRKIGAGNIGVERVFPAYSPFIDKVEVVAKGVVRRARLYYLRNLSGKSARIKSRFLGKVGEAPAAAAETPAS